MRNLYLLLTLIFLSTGCSSYKVGKDYVFPTKKGKAKYIASYNQTLKLWDVPFEETDLQTSFGMAHIIMCGPKSAEPLVLFHGTDASSAMWFPNIKEFSKNNRVYAIDFPLEAGKSLANRRKLSNPETYAFYKEIFEYYHMKDINLLGVSRGGWIATYLAVHPDTNIKRLILLSPANTFGSINKLGKVLCGIKLKLFPSKKSLNRFFEVFSYRPEAIDNDFKNELYLAYKYGNSKPRLLNMTTFSDEDLSKLKMPVLVLIGDHDVVNNDKIFERIHQFIPNAESAVIKDSGHFLSIDQSGTVNKKVTDFLHKQE